MCHMSHVHIFFLSVGLSWWRVWYQCGLTRPVYIILQFTNCITVHLAVKGFAGVLGTSNSLTWKQSVFPCCWNLQQQIYRVKGIFICKCTLFQRVFFLFKLFTFTCFWRCKLFCVAGNTFQRFLYIFLKKFYSCNKS